MRYPTLFSFMAAALLISGASEAYTTVKLRTGEYRVFPDDYTNLTYVSKNSYGTYVELGSKRINTASNVAFTLTNYWDEVITGTFVDTLESSVAEIRETYGVGAGSLVLTTDDPFLQLEKTGDSIGDTATIAFSDPTFSINSMWPTNFYVSYYSRINQYLGVYNTAFDHSVIPANRISASRLEYVIPGYTNQSFYLDNTLERSGTMEIDSIVNLTNTLRTRLGGFDMVGPAHSYWYDPLVTDTNMIEWVYAFSTNPVVNTNISWVAKKITDAPVLSDTSWNLLDGSLANAVRLNGASSWVSHEYTTYGPTDCLAMDRITDASSYVEIDVPAGVMTAGRVYALRLRGVLSLDSEGDTETTFYTTVKWGKTGGTLSDLSWGDGHNGNERLKLIYCSAQPLGGTLRVTPGANTSMILYHAFLTELDTRRQVFNSSGTRNTSCWAYGIDMTPFSIDARPVTAISKNIVVGVYHYPPSIGSKINFRTSDGVLIQRTLSASKLITLNAGKSSIHSDAWIGVLDSDLPSSIKPAKLMPANWNSYLPGGSYSLPMLTLNQKDCVFATLGDPYYFASGFLPAIHKVTNTSSRDRYPEARKTLTTVEAPSVETVSAYSAYNLDSGSPIFTCFNGETILISSLTTPASGESYADMLDEINAAVTQFASTNFPETIDLSIY